MMMNMTTAVKGSFCSVVRCQPLLCRRLTPSRPHLHWAGQHTQLLTLHWTICTECSGWKYLHQYSTICTEQCTAQFALHRNICTTIMHCIKNATQKMDRFGKGAHIRVWWTALNLSEKYWQCIYGGDSTNCSLSRSSVDQKHVRPSPTLSNSFSAADGWRCPLSSDIPPSSSGSSSNLHIRCHLNLSHVG